MEMPVVSTTTGDASTVSSPIDGSGLFARLRTMALPLRHRLPPTDDDARWLAHRIGGRTYRVAQPITFTPYASARPCSARCRFCSENLRTVDGGPEASLLRPQTDYFDALHGALRQLRGLPLSYSLSGLETTDDPEWCLAMLRTLDEAARDGVPVDERVLYSNGAGFAHANGERLIDALVAFGLSWLELSRHHHDEVRNRAIMRFRPQETIDTNPVFETVARRLVARLPLRVVCIVQRGGVETAQDVADYLRWADTLGARTVIFREFSRLDARYRDNATRRYIDSARVPIEALIEPLIEPLVETMIEGRISDAVRSQAGAPEFTPLGLTEGYYFWNLRLRHRSGIEAVFESSDYAAMHRRHASGVLYKLVFHANGRLCAGWSPDRDVLWSADDA
jgi:hypothetical protein